MKVLVKKLAEVWSLLVGLAITGKYFLSRDVTVYYPRQTIEPERLHSYRGPIELVGLDNDPAVPRCISCMMCAQCCPSGCIKVVKSPAPKPTPEEQKAMAEAEARGEKVKKPAAPKNPSVWEYDYTLCSLCGTCVEVCPVDSIRFSRNYYLAGTSPSDFHFNLLARLRRLSRAAAAPQGDATANGAEQTPPAAPRQDGPSAGGAA